MKFIASPIRFLLEAILFYLIFNNEEFKDKSDKYVLIRTSSFSLVYLLFNSIFFCLATNTAIVRLISTSIFIFYLLIESKDIKEINLIVTYSCIINFIMESIHFLSFKCISLLCYFGGILDTINHDLCWLIIVVLYCLIIFLIWKFDVIKIGYIRSISKHKFTSLISIALIVTLVLIKYGYKHLKSLEYCLAISNIILFMIPIILLIAFLIIKRVEHKNKIENKLVEEEIYSGMDQISNEIGITPQEYSRQERIFKEKLGKMGIDIGLKGFSPMVLCLIIIKNIDEPNINLTQNVYPIVKKRIEGSISNIEKNMINVINKAIDQMDIEDFERECGISIDRNKGTPSLKKFLINLARHTDI